MNKEQKICLSHIDQNLKLSNKDLILNQILLFQAKSQLEREDLRSDGNHQ